MISNNIRKLYTHHPGYFINNIAIPWETDYAALVPRFTGGLSAISSALIIYVLLRSKTGLSSIYHRIMFGMSLADICGSIAMALTSLPMPSLMPKEEEFGYHWAGARLGNTSTCNAQGFFSTFGMVCVYNYNAMLCVYYACAIAFTMKESNIKTYVEPLLHGTPVIIGLLFAIIPLFYELYNPGISAFAWCGPETYPNECAIYYGVECIRGNAHVKKILQILISIIITSDFTCILLCLGLVIYKVIQTDHVMVQISKIYRDCGNSKMEKVLERHKNTKVVILQASSYIAAFVLGIMPPALLSIGAVQADGKDGNKLVADIFEKIMLVLLPLQGFFNFVIFVSHKVYNYRRVHCDVSICKVITLLLCSSAHDPYFISRISVVQEYHDDIEAEERNLGDAVIAVNKSIVYELNVHDESSDQQQELHYRLGLMNNASFEKDAAILSTNNEGHNVRNCEHFFPGRSSDLSISHDPVMDDWLSFPSVPSSTNRKEGANSKNRCCDLSSFDEIMEEINSTE